MSRCIDCMYCVTQGQPPRKGLCWKEAEGTRKPKDIHQDRKCDDFALGAMHQLRNREGWRP
jgi:hypothetical protein